MPSTVRAGGCQLVDPWAGSGVGPNQMITAVPGGAKSDDHTHTLIGMVLLGSLGALVGLIRGFQVYPPTAWFAVFEVGLPALFVGAVLGAIFGLVARK
jgi:hypothetical protein